MPVKEPQKNASFSVICRSNYFKDIRPADPQSKKGPGYLEAVATAQAYFKAGEQEVFRSFLSEAKYLADLWAAHLVLEYGQPDAALCAACLEVIERYAASAFDKELARQEQQWLKAWGKAAQGGK